MVSGVKASDGHELRTYECGSGKRGLLVVQEIFGVNSHIRAVCEGFAQEGYQVRSPFLFDRIRPQAHERPYGIELDYSEVSRGQSLAREIGFFHAPLLDVEACLAGFPKGMPVAVVGYCWGGTLAWLSAVHLPINCAVSYYGGSIASRLDPLPRAPVMLHFGQHDPYIPREEVEKIRAAAPMARIYVYPAGHGFNCDQRADYHAPSAELAWRRTLEFLKVNLA